MPIHRINRLKKALATAAAAIPKVESENIDNHSFRKYTLASTQVF
jgi:hypothetical protein